MLDIDVKIWMAIVESGAVCQNQIKPPESKNIWF